jgi:hypothetical protein
MARSCCRQQRLTMPSICAVTSALAKHAEKKGRDCLAEATSVRRRKACSGEVLVDRRRRWRCCGLLPHPTDVHINAAAAAADRARSQRAAVQPPVSQARRLAAAAHIPRLRPCPAQLSAAPTCRSRLRSQLARCFSRHLVCFYLCSRVLIHTRLEAKRGR